MPRTYGVGILQTVQTLLETNLNSKITELGTKYSVTDMEQVLKVSVGFVERQYPECHISLDDSTIPGDQQLSMDIDQTYEDYPMDVVIILKDITNLTYVKQEIYIEALQRVLHGYSDSNITWILVTGGIRADMYTEKKEILRTVGVSLTIRS